MKPDFQNAAVDFFLRFRIRYLEYLERDIYNLHCLLVIIIFRKLLKDRLFFIEK